MSEEKLKSKSEKGYFKNVILFVLVWIVKSRANQNDFSTFIVSAWQRQKSSER